MMLQTPNQKTTTKNLYNTNAVSWSDLLNDFFIFLEGNGFAFDEKTIMENIDDFLYNRFNVGIEYKFNNSEIKPELEITD